MTLNEFITLLGVALTFIVSIISLITSLHTNRMGRYNNVISRVRSDWVRDLRLESADFIKYALNCLNNVGDWEENYAFMHRHAFVVHTHLGKKFPQFKEMIDKIIDLVKECNENHNMDKNLKNERFEVLLKDFYQYSIDCFIQQWSVSKHEAYTKK